MTEQSGEFRPNDEVDEMRWLKLGSVGSLLTYDHDLAVVAGLHLQMVGGVDDCQVFDERVGSARVQFVPIGPRPHLIGRRLDRPAA